MKKAVTTPPTSTEALHALALVVEQFAMRVPYNGRDRSALAAHGFAMDESFAILKDKGCPVTENGTILIEDIHNFMDKLSAEMGE